MVPSSIRGAEKKRNRRQLVGEGTAERPVKCAGRGSRRSHLKEGREEERQLLCRRYSASGWKNRGQTRLGGERRGGGGEIFAYFK